VPVLELIALLVLLGLLGLAIVVLSVVLRPLNIHKTVEVLAISSGRPKHSLVRIGEKTSIFVELAPGAWYDVRDHRAPPWLEELLAQEILKKAAS
jgi:hypothetical protein